MAANIKMPGFLKAAAEITANRMLVLNEASQKRLEDLDRKAVAVQVKGLGLNFFVVIVNQSVSIFDTYDGVVDVTVAGMPSAFIKLLVQDDIMMLLQSGEIEMCGDVRLGRKLKQIFLLSAIDWEELAAAEVGDMPAYHLGKFLKGVARTVMRVSDSVSANLSEYMQEEARILPSAIELENFARDVDELRDGVERLAGRFQKVEMMIKKK